MNNLKQKIKKLESEIENDHSNLNNLYTIFRERFSQPQALVTLTLIAFGTGFIATRKGVIKKLLLALTGITTFARKAYSSYRLLLAAKKI